MTNQDLVPVFTGQLQDQSTQLCNARDLHAVLEVATDFSDWIKNRIEKYGFTEGEDFSLNFGKTSRRGGRPATDYHLTLDMAKELAMVENNEQGRTVRRYFIACEKKLRQPAPVLPEPGIDVRALLLEDNSTPTVAPSAKLQQAIDKKAVEMALEAYELCRQHLARRVAYQSEIGLPRRVDEKLALRAIADADLGQALTAKYYNQLRAIALLADMVSETAIKHQKTMSEVIRKFPATPKAAR